MRKSRRSRSSINDTIDNWNGISFHNPILNHIWTILPGFTLWQIWKERNKRIFHSQSSSPEATWEKVKSLIQETTRSKPWSEEDQKCRPEEHGILQNWQPITSNLSTQNVSPRPPDSPSSWSPPPAHFIKVNFDGASKGHPGPAGYGAVLRNIDGTIKGLEAGFLGETSNNVAELTGLLRGLQTALRKGYQRLILEGDSQIIIRLTTRILHGCNPGKISPSWRLHSLLADFNSHLHPHLSIITSHVKRDANKVADRLANEAVETGEERLCWDGLSLPAPEILTSCQALANRDLHPPDGVTEHIIQPRGGESGRGVNRPTGPCHLAH
jgi:ribonuclease HI